MKKLLFFLIFFIFVRNSYSQEDVNYNNLFGEWKESNNFSNTYYYYDSHENVVFEKFILGDESVENPVFYDLYSNELRYIFTGFGAYDIRKIILKKDDKLYIKYYNPEKEKWEDSKTFYTKIKKGNKKLNILIDQKNLIKKEDIIGNWKINKNNGNYNLTNIIINFDDKKNNLVLRFNDKNIIFELFYDAITKEFRFIGHYYLFESFNLVNYDNYNSFSNIYNLSLNNKELEFYQYNIKENLKKLIASFKKI